MTISKELLDELLKGVERPEDLLGDAGLMKGLKIKIMERMPGAELTTHLGYEEGKEAPPGQTNRRNGASAKVLKGQDGELPLAVPRDRDGSFEPELVKKGQTRTCGMDDKIVGLYAAGLTVRDIQAHLLDLYGLKVSPDLISRVTDAVLDEVREWQSRAPERMYPIVIFDGCHCRAIGPSDNGDAGEDPRCRQPDGERQGSVCGFRPHPRRPARRSGPVDCREWEGSQDSPGDSFARPRRQVPALGDERADEHSPLPLGPMARHGSSRRTS